MCLFTKQKEPLVAQNNIECFKVLQEKDGKYMTPYMDYPIEFNTELTAKEEKKEPIFLSSYNCLMVEGGYFHTCLTMAEIQKTVGYIGVAFKQRGAKCPKLKVFKAVIPAGARYYAGVSEDICSDKLIITEEIME